MSEWSHLPNAAHIDRVIASVKEHSEIWGAAWSTACYAVRIAAWNAAWGAAQIAARDAAWSAAYNAARSAALEAARSAALEEARSAALDAILAIVVYDDCDQYLNMSSEELKVWAYLSERSAAVLLLPAVVAFERITELEQLDKELF